MNIENHNPADNDLSQNKNQEELDNDTYGHSSDPGAFKKKNEPSHHIEENTDASTKLKDSTILDNDDLSTRNKSDDTGLGGKPQ